MNLVQLELLGRAIAKAAQDAQALPHVERERDEWRDKYMALLNDSISHGEHMMGGLLSLVMKPGVMDALGRANDDEATK